MSTLTREREAVQETIALNPHTLSVTRPNTSTNARGVAYENTSSSSTVNFSNPVRIFLNNKKGTKVVGNEKVYFNDKVYMILTDYETIIQKKDRFTWQSRNWVIQDVEPITFLGSVVKYQAELQEATQGTA